MNPQPDTVYKAAVIGSGSAGLTLAIGLAGFNHEVALIEAGRVGGDCTNVGCIPSKALLHAAAAGVEEPLRYVRAKRDELNRRETEEMAEHELIHLVWGRGRLTAGRDPHVVEVTGDDGVVSEVRAENVIVCTGSRPVEIPIEGLDPSMVLNNENLFDLDAVPRCLVVVGGGPIGLEMATAFADLATSVHVVELADRILAAEEPIVTAEVHAALEAQGVVFHTGTSIERVDGSSVLLADGSRIDGVDKVLVAVGRRPRVEGLGLKPAGVEVTSQGIVADTWGRTNVDGVYAVGDVTGETATTHGANSIGRRAVRAIALPLPTTGKPRVQPNAVFCRPEVASVGLTVDEVAALPASGRRRLTVRLADIDRGYTDDLQHGLAVVDVERFSGKILRATIVAPHAAELIGLFTMAIDHGIGLRKLFGMVHPYPAHAELIGRLADDFARVTYPAAHKELPAMVWGRARAMLRKPAR